MGRYSVLDDPAADATVQRVLDMVVAELCALLGERLRAVVLAGGYGRGEGGICQGSTGYRLVNDLDLLIFLRGGMNGRAKADLHAQLDALAQRLAPMACGVKQIDLTVANTLALRFAPNLVYYYELVSGHQVIYGILDLRKMMPSYDPRKLHPIDGTIYFSSRGNGLLLPGLYWATGHLDDTELQENFQIETQKACQAMGDALLLLTGQYHSSYRERLARFERLDPRTVPSLPDGLFDRVAPLYVRATDRKLLPAFQWDGKQQMVDQWFMVRAVFGDFFLWYESKRLKQDFDTWLAYSNCIHEHGVGEPISLRLQDGLRNAVRQGALLGKRSNPCATRKHQLSMMPLLLFGIGPSLAVDQDFVRKAANLLGEDIRGDDEPLSDWIRLVQRHLMTFHPGGVVQEIVDRLRQ